VVEATKTNLDINNELNVSRDLIAKVSKMLNYEKNKNAKLEAKIKNLEELINGVGNKFNQSKHNENKKSTQQGNDNVVIVDAKTENSLSDSSINSDELSEGSIKFPDKVNYNSVGNKLCLDIISENGDGQTPTKTIQSNFTPTHGKSKSVVPKLNLKPIQSKFNLENKIEKTNSKSQLNSVEQSLNKTIEKLNGEIKQKDEKITQLKQRLSKYKSFLESAKEKISVLTKDLNEIKEQNEFFNNNIEIKENNDEDFKKIYPSTEDVSNKRGFMIDSCSAEREGINDK
jgi:chromosome segregation ATPase